MIITLQVNRRQNIKSKPCKLCGSMWHTAFGCKYRPKKPLKNSATPLRLESPKNRQKRLKMSQAWFRANPSDKDGYWECYLRISRLCPIKLRRETITLEHVYAKVRRPDLKYEPLNLKPSCSFCNKMKGSRSVAQLAKVFPHINVMINSKEWQEWQKQLNSNYIMSH